MQLLTIRALNPAKYALALMDAIFSDEEMSSHCFACSPRGSKQQLPQEKINLITGILLIFLVIFMTSNRTFLADCIDKKYGRGAMLKNEHEIKKKCNQKCIDVASNKRMEQNSNQ